MIRTQISMTERQAEALRRVAAARRVSQAAVMRDALDELVDDAQRIRLVERALGSVGGWSSTGDDSAPVSVSEQHDAELDDAFAS